jgi:hypothetical protein
VWLLASFLVLRSAIFKSLDALVRCAAVHHDPRSQRIVRCDTPYRQRWSLGDVCKTVSLYFIADSRQPIASL